MPTLNGEMPRRAGDVPEAPCIWCGKPTDMRFTPEAMPHLGPQPLHIICAHGLIRAYERWMRGHVLDGPTAERLKRTGSGHAASVTALQREQAIR